MFVAPSSQATTLHFCAEPGDRPPWFYLVKDQAGKPTGASAGFSREVITTVFTGLGYQLEFHADLPWPRCLQAVERGEIDFAFGGYYDAERAKRFAFSKPYKILTPQIFYATKRPIKVTSITDLKRYRGCGMHGSSYQHYGLKEQDLDLGTTKFERLILKLKLGRCDYFPEELEIIAHLNMGRDQYTEDADLRHIPIAGASAPGLHLLGAKTSSSTALLEEFNRALGGLIKSGQLKALWEKNAGNFVY